MTRQPRPCPGNNFGCPRRRAGVGLGSRTEQDVWAGHRPQRCRLRGSLRRDPRPGRAERIRQVDVGQGPLRRAPSRRGRCRRGERNPAVQSRASGRAAAARAGVCPPGPGAGRRVHGAREHAPRPVLGPVPQSADRLARRAPGGRAHAGAAARADRQLQARLQPGAGRAGRRGDRPGASEHRPGRRLRGVRRVHSGPSARDPARFLRDAAAAGRQRNRGDRRQPPPR